MKKVIIGERPVSRQLLMFLTLVTHLTIGQGQSSRIYVNQHSSGSNTGESWLNAYPDLQHALNRAQYGDTIWVAEGTYKPTSTTDRTISFELKNGVVLMGGFAGYEQSLDERDLESFKTVLSGDIGEEGGSLDNTYNVVYAAGVDSMTVLDGFTITSGVANYDDPSFSSRYLFGGGLLVETKDEASAVNPVIRECKFINNIAWYGGGLAIRALPGHMATPLIKKCEFIANQANGFGGGIYFVGDSFSERKVKVLNCLLEENWATTSGGGIYFGQGNWGIVIEEVHLNGNACYSNGGGIAVENGVYEGSVDLRSCQFESNKATEGAGFLAILEGTDFLNPKDYRFKFIDCRFEENGNRDKSGGGVAVIGLANNVFLDFNGCDFVNNHARFNHEAIQVVIHESDTFALTLENTKIENSLSGIGGISVDCERLDLVGAVKIKNSLFSYNNGVLDLTTFSSSLAVEISNSTFINNGPVVIKKPILHGAANIGIPSKLQIVNSVFWEPQTTIGGIFFSGDYDNIGLQDFDLSYNLISAPACDLPGGEEACGAGNLFNVNPHFRDSLNGDFRLAGCSPAINAGVNNGLIGEFDLDGNPRILEDRVDIGAYEQATFDLVISTIQAAEVSCFGEGDGEVVVTTNGEAPLSYEWSQNGSLGAGNTDLEPGLYAMTVTDQQSCEENLFVQIDEPDSLMASFTAIPSTPGQSDGYINLEQIQGGRQPYQWNWSNGATTASISDLANGMYEASVTDGNGCTKSWSFLLEAPDASLEPSAKAQLSISPNPLSNGQILSISYQLERSQYCNFKLINFLGQQVQYTTLRLGEKGTVKWPIKLLPKGTYLLQVLGENGGLLAIDRLVLVE